MGKNFADYTYGAEPPVPALPAKLRPAPAVPDVSARAIKALAKQSRPLLPDEASDLRGTFGNALNPDVMRLAYDEGTSATNLYGWTDRDRYPTVMFVQPMARDLIRPETMPHEATHTWQALTRDAYTNNHELQAERVEKRDPKMIDFIKSHPATDAPRADVAFLDSIRERYGDKSGDADANARKGAVLGGVTHVKQMKRVDPWTHFYGEWK